MRRWFGRLLLAGVFALLLVTGLAWLMLRASLPTLDGELAVAGLAAPATIARDAAGIPVITAASRTDLAFATGFAHGQDRFFQMDTIRRRAAGELSELIGSATVETDRSARLHRFRDRARTVLSGLDPAARLLLARYADGVNAGLASLQARPFEYFLLGAEPRPWAAEDSLLVWYTMFLRLNDELAERDVRRGLARRVLPAEVFDWMYPQGTPWDAPLMGESRPAGPAPAADVYSVRDVSGAAPPADEQGKKDFPGSNNWAVAGRLTTNGRAMVANDMHLSHAVPNIWYRARLVVVGAGARDVTGVTIPGTPFVVAGSNGQVAWGFTNSYGDWTDAVLLIPGAAPGTYRTPAGDRVFEKRTELITVKNADPVKVEFRDTIWGPVRDDIDYPDGEIAVAWIAHAPAAVNLANVDLETAQSVTAALDIASHVGMPPQNFVAGDADGNIGWTIAGRIPVRRGYDPLLPADWSDTAGWDGWLAPADYPRIVNPADGRIWTANARVADGEALELIGDGGYDLGARARQIRDGLLAKDRFEPADMLAIQTDDRALFLARWQGLLLDLLDDDAVAGDRELSTYRDLVRDWVPRAAPESVGYRLVRAFRLEVEAQLFHALTAPARAAYGDDVELRVSHQFEAPLWQVVTERPLHLLPGDYASWDEFLLAAVRRNLAWFDTFDGPLAERRWGERNTASIRHPLSAAVPLFGARLDMPAVPLPGDVDLPRAQGPAFGASERFAVAPGDEASGLMHMPTGQSGHPLSPFYRSGHRDWVEGVPAPFLPGAPAHTLELVPGT
ncbi:MAG: penicillin acylase family protein [Woeseiaceae bacterium]|nr:penicillin acylase family protein [Woeseiaceae bacterium]